MSPPKGSGRLPPRLHPDDMKALSEQLEEIIGAAVGDARSELEAQTTVLREELEKLDRRTRPGEIVVGGSHVRRLEERILRLEGEVRDLIRSQIKHFLAMDDLEGRMEELASGQVQELRDELTG